MGYVPLKEDIPVGSVKLLFLRPPRKSTAGVKPKSE